MIRRPPRSTPFPTRRSSDLRLGLAGETDVIVTSDHGFCSFSGELDLRAELVRAGMHSAERDEDVIVIGEQIYVREDRPERVAARSEEHTSELQSRQYLVCRL